MNSFTDTDSDLPPNTPLPMDLFVAEMRRVYSTTYLEEAIACNRPLATLRPNIDTDIDYDERTDRLYVWFEDPDIATTAGVAYAGATLTSYPDVLHHVSALAPKDVLAWLMMRARTHHTFDHELSQCRSSTQLKPRLMHGIKYVAPDDTVEERDKGSGKNGGEVF